MLLSQDFPVRKFSVVLVDAFKLLVSENSSFPLFRNPLFSIDEHLNVSPFFCCHHFIL